MTAGTRLFSGSASGSPPPMLLPIEMATPLRLNETSIGQASKSVREWVAARG